MSKWIDVKHFLPPSRKIVICKTNAPPLSYPEYLVSEFDGESGKWLNILEYTAMFRSNDSHEITHWKLIEDEIMQTFNCYNCGDNYMDIIAHDCTKKIDNVNHPAHYNNSKAKCDCGRSIECIDVTRHLSFNIGNAIKYLWRCEHKGSTLEDLKKARWYIEDQIKQLEMDK